MRSYLITKIHRWGQIVPVPDEKLMLMLNSKLSYKLPGIEFMPNPLYGIVRLYKKEKGMFPWGLLYLVREIFDEWVKYSGEQYSIDYTYNIPHEIKFIDSSLRDYQKEAIVKLYQNDGGILNLPTASGKTRIALEYMTQKKVRTLIIVPTIEIQKQWKSLTPNYADVRTYQGINNYKDLEQYQLIILDEVHIVAAKKLYNIAMRCCDAQLIGMSASCFRTDGNEMKIWAAIGKIIFSISRKELIDKGYLSDAKVYYHTIKDDEYKYWENYQEAYEGYIVNNIDRNAKIVDIAIKEYSEKRNVLILCNVIKHMDNLYSSLIGRGVNGILYVNGTLKKKERDNIFCEINKLKIGQGAIIIASTIYDLGVNFETLDCLILAAGGQSAVKLVQRVGRILRIYENKQIAIIHDFQDSCRWLKKHSKQRRELLSQDFTIYDE